MKKIAKGAFLSLLMLFPFIVPSCGSSNATDITDFIENRELGSAQIQNISEYSSIGVVRSSNQVNQLSKKDNRSENEETLDISAKLVGLNSHQEYENLVLSVRDGDLINSEDINICGFFELGDFVIFSVLPMSSKEYLSFIGRDSSSYQAIADSLSNISLSLGHSIKYRDPKTKEDKYFDTSYLLHKRSGKIFPLSSRRICVDASSVNIKNDPTLWGRKDEDYKTTSTETIKDALWSLLTDKYGEEDSIIDVSKNDTFENGFWVDNFVVEFNTETNNIEIQSKLGTAAHRHSAPDKWGNIIVEANGGYYFLRNHDKAVISIGQTNSYELDPMLRQFSFSRYLQESRTRVYSFLNKDLLPDSYSLTLSSEQNKLFSAWKQFYKYDTRNPYSFGSCDNNAAPMSTGTVTVSEYEICACPQNYSYNFSIAKGIYVAHLNSYKKYESFEQKFDEEMTCAYNNYYYVKNGNLHKIEPAKGYSDTVISDSFEYTISAVFVPYGGTILSFEGLDQSLNTVTGYITEDDKITFEIITDTSKDLIIITPIN